MWFLCIFMNYLSVSPTPEGNLGGSSGSRFQVQDSRFKVYGSKFNGKVKLSANFTECNIVLNTITFN